METIAISWFSCGIIGALIFLKALADEMGFIDLSDVMMAILLTLLGPITLIIFAFVAIQNHGNVRIWERKDDKDL